MVKKDPKLGQALNKEKVQVSAHEDGTIYLRNSADDPDAPRSWPLWKKYCIVGLAWSARKKLTPSTDVCVEDQKRLPAEIIHAPVAGVEQMQKEFKSSDEIGTLGLSLFVLGFALGPLLLAPLSEYVGRRPVYLVSWGLFVIFQIPCAVAKNMATILVCRFIGGFFGSAPLANTGGVVHDLFARDECGYAVALYALSSTDGPPFGNVVSGFIAQQKGWRWLFWFNLILAGTFWVVIFFFLPETRDTILMMRKAKRLRKETGNENIFAEHEKERGSPGHFYKVSLLRPFRFFFTEPITYLTALINGFTFGLIFLSNEAFGLVFSAASGNGGHPWTHSGIVNLTFLAFVIGALIGFALQPLQERIYHRGVAQRGKWPEGRWASSLVGVWLMPIGLFIAAWTSYAFVPWIGPVIGFTVFGVGFFCIINAILNYVVDSYGHFAASSLAAVVCIRNICGAGAPLFARQMFVKLDNQWALFLCAMLSLFMVPVPFYLLYRGERVRYASPYCREHFDTDD
ncbi:MAG: hypothetical protein CYPHOPRED_002084 [Cyphobasidiales sp. Tagirdzhanova-0007]|nr:MAG: hypothetical protein CYPHOPRED_002084 [Cyphobasidiales sp. Tagirdzhanova-0007]